MSAFAEQSLTYKLMGGKYSKFFFSGITELFESKLCLNVL
jgi:hypothetical protein